MTDSASEGLKGDPKRQAVASLRGYAYQIWQSVERWITLREDEVLYLEGAEDLDVLGPEKAETIQVKDIRKSGSLTIRSSSVLDAITHFWEIQEKHSNLTIHFRLLTTAERGREQGVPFGDRRGLDYWDLCKRPGTDLNPLREFLKAQLALPETLRDFLAVADDSTLRDRLLVRIVWDTGNEPKAYIEELINRKVTHYGQRYHYLPPSESLKVVSHLLKHVWDVICREAERRLDNFDFMQLFEQVTTERLSKHELGVLRQLSTSLAQRLLTQGGLGGIGSSPDLQSIGLKMIPPPLPDRAIRRQGLVTALAQCMKTQGILILKGSTGMGKSTLAALIAHADVDAWKWLNLRGRKPEEIRDILYRTIVADDDRLSALRFVIDDLDLGSRSAPYEHALTGFFYAILSRGGQIIVTTQGELPSQIISHLQPGDSTFEVPPLDLVEIRQMVKDHGYPPEGKRQVWTGVIFAKTRGHPQLAHAWVRKLETKGWPNPGPDDLADTQDIQMVRREARIMLREQLPSEDARTLVYRLSTIGQAFRRDHALQLAMHRPPLAYPGEAFDLLVGPWIERVNETYYQISPLLEGAAVEIWPPQQMPELHRAVAEAFLSCKRLTLLEVSGMLRHGLEGEAIGPIVATLGAFLNAKTEVWPRIAQEFLWIVLRGLLPGERLFASNPYFNAMLRFFQFRIAVEIDGETVAPLIANNWEQEIELIQIPEFKSFWHLLFCVETILHYQVPVSQRVVVLRTAEAMRLINSAETLLGAQIPEQFGDRGTIKELITFAVARCKTTDDLAEFLSALAEQPDETRQAILLPFQATDYWANLLCGKVWFNETSLPVPNWTRCIELFERTISLGMSWGVNSLVAAAYHALGVIHDEYLGDPQAALAILVKGQAQIEQGNPILENARAMVLFRSERYQEALQIWEAVLPHWPQGADTLPAFAYRHAAICAAEEGHWSKAADMALKGEEAAHRAGLSVMAIGLRADYAFARWKCGDATGAIASFAKVLDVFPTLPDPQKDVQSYALQIRVDYGVNWMIQNHRRKQPHPEPLPGYLSDPAVDETYKDHRIRPVVMIWNALAYLEYETNSGNAIFKRLEEESKKSSTPEIDLLVEYLRICHALKRLQLESLVIAIEKYCQCHEFILKLVNEGKIILEGEYIHAS